jgi:hypothetical protein
VFGRPPVIEFFASGKLVIRIHFQVYDQITDGQFHAGGRSAMPSYDFILHDFIDMIFDANFAYSRKNQIFSDFTLSHSLNSSRGFEGSLCLHFQYQTVQEM